MLLVIDVGNTQTVFGVYQNQSLAHHFRLQTDAERTADEYGVMFRELLHDVGVSLQSLQAAVLASVVPPLTATISQMCRLRLGFEPLLIEPGVKTGMPVLYESPRDVGADRIVNSVAGYELYRAAAGGPYGLIIVDFGTATTFDVVSPRGEYLGGAIAPGIGISTDALFKRASKLPRVELRLPRSAIGRTTVTSMQAGILYGYVALVDGMVKRMRSELDFEPKILATGGTAHLVAPSSEEIERIESFLTLEGMRIIFERNQASTPGVLR